MFTNAATQTVGGDPIGDILRRVAVFVRGYIQSAPRAVRLPADETMLPDALIAPAMDYAAIDVLKKLPLTVTDERKKAREDAIKLFERVADGRYVIKEEDAPPDSQSPVSVQMASRSPRRVTAWNVGGLP